MTELMVEGVEVRYGTVAAVKGVSFGLASGKTLALLGPSGCGKTTLLNGIAGFVPLAAGAIRLGDRDVTNVPVRARGLSMVFQTHALFPHMTVWDNIEFGLRLRKLARREAARRVAEVLDLVQLRALAKRYPSQLSGGQRQRVALARALVIEPAVMLLDEPLSSLDAKLRGEMRISLRRIQVETGVTMVYVTHDKDEAFSLGDQVGIMRDGELVQFGSPREVCEVPASGFVASFLTDCNLLPGRVVSVDRAAMTCTTSVTGVGTIVSRNPHRLDVGMDSVVSVPRNAIGVSTSHDGLADNDLPASVSMSRFMGDRVEVVSRCRDVVLTATIEVFRSAAASELVDEQQIWLGWAAQDACALPSADGEALARARPPTSVSPDIRTDVVPAGVHVAG